MLKAIVYGVLICGFLACEEAAEADKDRNLIDEEKVQLKYQRLKNNLKEAGEEIDSMGIEIKKEVKEISQKVDEEL